MKQLLKKSNLALAVCTGAFLILIFVSRGWPWKGPFNGVWPVIVLPAAMYLILDCIGPDRFNYSAVFQALLRPLSWGMVGSALAGQVFLSVYVNEGEIRMALPAVWFFVIGSSLGLGVGVGLAATRIVNLFRNGTF